LLPWLAVLLPTCSAPLDPAAQEEARAFPARYDAAYFELPDWCELLIARTGI
jgi:hypothetical protein